VLILILHSSVRLQNWFVFPIGEASVTLELLGQKARGFLASIVLKWLFLEHARKVFGEMPVSI
jgi:hypothetical protein